MPIDKKTANKILATLDATAAELEKLAKDGKLNPKMASALVREVDVFADKFQVAAFGKDSLDRWRGKVSKVLQRDSDEKFMDTFDNPNKVIEGDADEDYMHKVGPSFNSKGIGTYDVDQSSAVTDRDEFAVRDLSEWADSTTKQPSWSKGPAGKSTKQGAADKSWATLTPTLSDRWDQCTGQHL